MEDETGVFAEAGEVALGVVAGKGGYQLGGGLAYLEGLVHCGGLTVIVIMVGGVCAGFAGQKNLLGEIISSGICEVTFEGVVPWQGQ